MNCYAEIFNDIDLVLNKYDQIHYHKLKSSKNLQMFWNNEQLWAKANTVTDDKEKISHSYFGRDFLKHCFITL